MLSKPEVVFLSCLPTGRDNAITARELGGLMMQRLGYCPSDRVVRRIASDLRRRGHLIASSPTTPFGFYRPATLAEAEACREQLARRLREVRRTVAAFDRALRRQRVEAALAQGALPGLERGV